jgi:hypothetical protein
MSKQPIINGKVVERAYEDYRQGLYLINRRYQRKLVWSAIEKKSFIDSLANGYPVPLFLFSNISHKGIVVNEIIDGMQRLNAVFSYIENEYANHDGYYFDLSTTALTKDLMDKGILNQKNPILERSICIKIASYELPYSIYSESNSDIIDEVFRRINANGRHLSRQEIRQAGVTSDFAQLVRKLSTQIRGDVSHDEILLLSKMNTISISQENDNGINADSVFWVKENIINKKDLRQSMDEEQVADLLAGMILDQMPPSDVSVLDGYYGSRDDSENRENKINEAVQKIGADKIHAQFMHVLDEIKKIFLNKHKPIVAHLVGPQRFNKGPRYFHVLFLAMYNLLIRKEKKINNYDEIFKCLENMGQSTIIISKGGGNWPAKSKDNVVTSTSAVLEKYFIDKSGNDPMYYSYSSEVENLLTQSRTENSQYDFKQGIYDLKNETRNDALLSKIFKTLTAMCNSEKNAVGYIIIGVADNLEDAVKIQEKYNIDYIKVGSFFITGIDGEVIKYFNSVYDNYITVIKNTLENMPIQEHYKRQIGSNIRVANYQDRTVIILKIVCDNGPAYFDEKYYTRMSANTDPIPVSLDTMQSFFNKFNIEK